MKISGIYQIQSKLKPERIYIGSAVDIHNRWRRHLWYLRNNNHHSSKLQRHFNKYGKSDLIFSIIIGCDKEDLISTEQYFLDIKNPFFNTCKIAGNTHGIKYSEETKKKLSILKKGKPTWNKGLKLSDEHKKHISESQMGDNNSFYKHKRKKEFMSGNNLKVA